MMQDFPPAAQPGNSHFAELRRNRVDTMLREIDRAGPNGLEEKAIIAFMHDRFGCRPKTTREYLEVSSWNKIFRIANTTTWCSRYYQKQLEEKKLSDIILESRVQKTTEDQGLPTRFSG